MVLCGGSATDLPVMGPEVARTSVLLTVLTHTQRFRSILQMWMLQQKQETM